MKEKIKAKGDGVSEELGMKEFAVVTEHQRISDDTFNNRNMGLRRRSGAHVMLHLKLKPLKLQKKTEKH